LRLVFHKIYWEADDDGKLEMEEELTKLLRTIFDFFIISKFDFNVITSLIRLEDNRMDMVSHMVIYVLFSKYSNLGFGL